MGRVYFIGSFVLAFGALALAQTPGGTVTKHSETQLVATDPPVNAPKTKGDTIHFKNGRILSGVQVIGKSADSIEVVPAPGVKSLSLPMDMIESIDYDNINDAKGNWLLDGDADSGKAKLLKGKEISPELFSKITKPLFKDKRTYNDKDFKTLLVELAQECELEVVFGETVATLPKEKRVWNLELQPNTSFLNLLETGFSNSFPDVEWSYQFDKIAVNLKKDANTEK